LCYSSTCLAEKESIRRYGKDSAIEFSHTLEDQIGGQTVAGFHIVGLYESYVEDEPIREYMPTFIATRAMKPG